MEIKELGVTVQIRRADPSTVPVIMAQAEELRRTSAGEFRVWQSESTVDLFPDVDWRKGSSALWVLEQWMLEGRGQPIVVYLGDDDADEVLTRTANRSRRSRRPPDTPSAAKTSASDHPCSSQ